MLLPAVNTLPVISEDEEDEMEEEGEVEGTTQTKTSGDEEDKEDTDHSSSSPLLSKFPGRANFPNGDIMGLRYAVREVLIEL